MVTYTKVPSIMNDPATTPTLSHPQLCLIAALFLVQATMYFFTLDLLPVWTDEQSTLTTVVQSPGQIIHSVKHDIHPPLYFLLLHKWNQLPLPWTGIARLRAFSAVSALLSTLLFFLFFARALPGRTAVVAVSLMTFSPCLLLYGRMARSYSLQAALAVLVLGLLQRWIRRPDSLLLMFAVLSSLLGLLYTHYVPGLAVLTGLIIAGWRQLGPLRVGTFCAIVSIGYAPWLTSVIAALTAWGRANAFSSRYTLTGNPVTEQAVKTAFGAISLFIGESFSGAALILVPVLLFLAYRGAQAKELGREVKVVVAVSAAVGYLGVSRWVSYPFIPARLLWLLPSLLLLISLGIIQFKRPAMKGALIMIVLLTYLSGDVMYFRRDGFLNHGYTVPLPEISRRLNREARAEDIILMDTYNTDSAALAASLSGSTSHFFLLPDNVEMIRMRIPSASVVWIVRNTRDISPGGITSRLQSEACAGRSMESAWYEPYTSWQRGAMRLIGIRPPLTHFYQVVKCYKAVF